jgi:multiple sugar transport system permease protein
LSTLPVALTNHTGEYVQDIELMMAGAAMTILPVMIVFIALQKYYSSGIMAAGLKE